MNESASQSAVEMAAELQRLRQEVGLLRAAAAAAAGGGADAAADDGGGGGAAGDLQVALDISRQLEQRNAHLQEQIGRMRQ